MYGESVNVGGELLNVGEAFTLTDTVIISEHVDSLSTPVPGWFSTFALAGAANSFPFFNVRNSAICDEAWNNQDTRDTAAFGMRILSIAIRWLIPMIGNPSIHAAGAPYEIEKYEQPALWSSLMPFNSAIIFRVQQDEKLKAQCAMITAGMGPVTDGYGQGGETAGWLEHLSVNAYCNSGEVHQKNKFPFPEVIDIPRRASVNAEIIFSDYARDMMQNMQGPGSISFYNQAGSFQTSTAAIPAVFGVQVEIKGQRLVQQRGQLHAS